MVAIRTTCGITPSCASANVVPIVGWPAMGNSEPGVKIRMRMSVPAVSESTRNVLSEKFISRVSVCICCAVSSWASGKTAS